MPSYVMSQPGGVSFCTSRCGVAVPIAKVAMARKLSVRLYWMWRKGWDYQQTSKFGSHVG